MEFDEHPSYDNLAETPEFDPLVCGVFACSEDYSKNKLVVYYHKLCTE